MADMKIYILDASGLINGFYSEKHLNITTPSVVSEIKDINTQIQLKQCIDDGLIKIEDVTQKDYENISWALIESGDFLRLSGTDKEVVALSYKYKKQEYDVVCVTDDYSMQNALKVLGIRFRSIATKGIGRTIRWKLQCKGCKKEYPTDYTFDECEICGSRIIRKRVNGKRNY